MKSIIKLIVFFSIWVVMVLVELSYRHPLFDESLVWIKEIQNHTTAQGRDAFKVITDIFGPEVLFPVSGAFFYNFGNIIDSFYVLSTLSFSGYLMGVTKIIYHDPRPFMVQDDIDSYTCSRGYGNPSGHSVSIAVATFTIVLIYNGYKAQFKHRCLYLGLLLTAAIILTALIGFSRLYLAAHSADQILYGWQWGLWFAFFYYYVFYEFYKYTLNAIFRHEKKPEQFFLCSVMVFVVCFVVSLIVYFSVEAHFSVPESWKQELYDKCGTSSSPAFTDKSMTDSGSIFLFFGQVVGFYLEQKCCGDKFGSVRWNKTPFWKSLLRLVILAVFLVIAGLPYLFVKYDEVGMAAYYTLRMGLTMFLIGFLMFGVLRRVFQAIGLANVEPGTSERFGESEREPFLRK